jgi:hypothetical protein
MRRDNHPGNRSRHPWSALLWLLSVLLLVGLTRLGASSGTDRNDSSNVPPAESASHAIPSPRSDIDHSSVNWKLHSEEPAQPGQSVAAYELD